MLNKSEAIREDKPGFHGYGSLSFLSQEKCNARTAGRKEQKQGQIHGQRVAQLLNIFHAGTSKKKAFLDCLEICGLRLQWCYIHILLLLCCDSISSEHRGARLCFWPLLTWASLPTPKRGQCWCSSPPRSSCQGI